MIGWFKFMINQSQICLFLNWPIAGPDLFKLQNVEIHISECSGKLSLAITSYLLLHA